MRIRHALVAAAVGFGAVGALAVVAGPAFAQAWPPATSIENQGGRGGGGNGTGGNETPSGTVKPKTTAKECIDKLENGGKIDDCQKAPSPILPAANELLWGGISFV